MEIPLKPDLSSEINNFQIIGPDLWRGGQPTVNAFTLLKDSGAKTIISLREDQPALQKEREIVTALGMDYYAIPIRLFAVPDEEAIDYFLDIVSDKKNQPCFVHCLHGMDRTGLVVAIYRMQFHDWTFEQAHEELLKMGFHTEFQNLFQVFVAYGERITQNKQRVNKGPIAG